jgi:hypothetical protein
VLIGKLASISTLWLNRLTFQTSSQALAIWEDLVYNLARPLKTRRLEVDTPGRRWLPRSPAMAAGLTDHI